jgi:accessory gene regulator protein AgrB
MLVSICTLLSLFTFVSSNIDSLNINLLVFIIVLISISNYTNNSNAE